MIHFKNKKILEAFTIVELVIVIAVIGILASISVVGYGKWRESIAQKEVQSDLRSAAGAMENARNFGSGYPLAIPLTFKASTNVSIVYAFGNPDEFCIEGKSKVVTSVTYFINNQAGKKEPRQGDCLNGEVPNVPGGSFYWKQIASGFQHSCAIGSDNKTYCWGYNDVGQLGNGTTTSSSKPVAVTMPSGKTFELIEVGLAFSCAVTTDGVAYCWGWNGSGQLGNNSTTNSSVPVAVSPGAMSGKSVASISGGNGATCARTTDGYAYCWGWNNAGQLGNNSTTNSSVPVAVSPGAMSGKSVASISEGNQFTCAVTTDGAAYCWGFNNFYQLGNGSTTDSSVPVAVNRAAMGNRSISSISASNGFTCALVSGGFAYCWGWNNVGQLGNNSTTNSSFPVLVQGAIAGKSTQSVSADDGYACASTVDGGAYCWGWNNVGQLGNNSTVDSLVSVKVSGLLTGKMARTVTAGNGFACVATNDTSAYCWGRGTAGELGNNTTITSSTPVLVTGP